MATSDVEDTLASKVQVPQTPPILEVAAVELLVEVLNFFLGQTAVTNTVRHILA
ncbi:hypothetical protein [Candidatus Mycolicibacterium alkanivorans]|uniref:Uncharacterized protein n=1 Tax=Candidatus Mycolicibacterium alkanivorans TaxID=2954114 RepID=A0ABS9YRH2_9MYCO|nr:hypothetical protein [Candidatus Mycolicibacterium alkanivorans]MCI4673428.1 hypothetical protein [Candidatus Mycolicibacterium alkanivorans]